MPKPDDMLEGQNVPENHGKPDTQDRGFKGGSSTDGSLEPSSQAIGPFDAGKAFFLGMFLPDLIAGALVVPESWARVIHILGLPAVAIYLSWSKGLCIKDNFTCALGGTLTSATGAVERGFYHGILPVRITAWVRLQNGWVYDVRIRVFPGQNTLRRFSP